MEPRLGPLRDLLEAFLQDLGDARRTHASGGSSAPPLERLFHEYPSLARVETLHEVREALEGQSKGSEEHRRLQRLAAVVTELAVDARAAESDERRATWELTAEPWPDEPSLSWSDAQRRIPREANRGRRALLARAVARELDAQERLFARRIDAVHEVADRLGLSSPLALYQTFGTTDLTQLEASAQALLSVSEDAYRDLLGYVLRRTEPSLRLSSAERHDLERGLLAPWTFADTSVSELTQAVRRWIEEWGLAANAGRMELDSADRAGKPFRSSIVPLRVPDKVFAFVRAEVGVSDSLALLRVQGGALSWALRDRRLPFEDRRLTPPRLQETFSGLFARMLTDPRWLERYLRLPKAGARELARLAAFAELTRLREAAAQLTFELQLLRRGADAELRDVYEDGMRKALGVGVPREAYLGGVTPHLAIASVLEGAALAGAAIPALRNRFDEDHWRNPNAAGVLRDIASKGGSDEAWLALLDAPAKASLADGARELIAVMGA